MRMREPEPTAPVAGWMSTPAARPFNRLCTSLMGAVWVTLAASIRETAMPSSRRAVAVGVPVTTTCDSSSTFSSSAIRTFSLPTRIVSSAARKPIRRACRTTMVPGTSLKRKRPLASVRARRVVPATVTCTSATGAPEARLVTVPATGPSCPESTAGRSEMPDDTNHRAARARDGEKRIPRSGRRGGSLYYRRAEGSQEGAERRTSVRRRGLPLPLELPRDLPRDVHRAELRPAHRAELGALEVLGGQRFVVQLASPRRVEGQPELLVPVEREPRARQGVVAVPGAGAAARDVRRVGGDLVGDHPLAHLLGVGETEVLLARHVAQHVRAVPADHRGADRRRDVIVPRGDVRHQRPQGVERRLAADLLLLADVDLDQVHRDRSEEHT